MMLLDDNGIRSEARKGKGDQERHTKEDGHDDVSLHPQLRRRRHCHEDNGDNQQDAIDDPIRALVFARRLLLSHVQ